MTFTIPMIFPSANQFYAGMHHMKRHALVNSWHDLILIYLRQEQVRPWREPYPVKICFECRFRKGARILDADNLFPTAKLIIDCMVKSGIIQGDHPKYVQAVELVSLYGPDKLDTTVVTISALA